MSEMNGTEGTEGTKLREALWSMLYPYCSVCGSMYEPCKHEDCQWRQYRDVLAAPPRNCDVGTADEQANRFDAFCKSFPACSVCPVHAVWNFEAARSPSCTLYWGQMAFEGRPTAGPRPNSDGAETEKGAGEWIAAGAAQEREKKTGE